ncbi:MAG: elongation factor Ts [bacterium]|nr:elongation factor Ts [bacterium]
MSVISASLVKELRERSGAGMMDCKKALAEAGGDLESAVDWLRTQGLAAAAKKSGRAAAEGLVSVLVEGNTGALVEVNAETDFVGRNDQFQAYVREVTKLAVSVGGDVEALGGKDYPGTGRTACEELTHLISVIGENMSLRRSATVKIKEGVVTRYIHTATTDGMGRIGVLVGLESTGDKAKLEALGRQIAMHVAAAKPQSLNREGLNADVVNREREIFAEQARSSGKPENIIEKMIEGRLRKFYEEAVLLDQTFIMDTDLKISQVVEAAAKDVGAPVTLSSFACFVLGDGVEKKEEDFAAEVAAVTGK